MLGPQARISIRYLIYTCGGGAFLYAVMSSFSDSGSSELMKKAYGKEFQDELRRKRGSSSEHKALNVAIRRAAGVPVDSDSGKAENSGKR